MSKRYAKPLIIDMLHCIQKVNEYTAGLNFDSFISNSMVVDAVLRNLQVLGEAASRLPLDFRQSHPEVEWTKIIRSRHITTHEYDNIDHSIIWKIIEVHFASLETSLENILRTLE